MKVIGPKCVKIIQGLCCYFTCVKYQRIYISIYIYIASKNLIFYSVVSYIWMFPVFVALFTVNNKNLSSVFDTLASSSHAKHGIMSEKNIILIRIELISLCILKNIQNNIK
jgi:hypothetical protein